LKSATFGIPSLFGGFGRPGGLDGAANGAAEAMVRSDEMTRDSENIRHIFFFLVQGSREDATERLDDMLYNDQFARSESSG